MIGPWRLPSVRWPMVLLFASLGFTTLGVVEANRAIRSQRTVAEHALRDYAGFVSWSYQQHLREIFASGTQEVLGAVNHGKEMHTNPEVPSVGMLPHYLPFDPRCGCHRSRSGPSPIMYFAWVLGSDTVGSAVNTHANPEEGWEVDRPMPMMHDARLAASGYSVAERRWINDTITKHIHYGADNGRFPIVIATHDTAPRLLVYTLMPTTWGDTLVYGAEYSRAAVRSVLADVMYSRDLLPATFTRGHSIREMIRLQVSDARGDVLFASEPVSAWTLDDTTRLSTEFGALLVRAQIRPEMAGSIVIGGLPRSRLPFLLGLLAVSAALSLVAIGQIRREGELARLRADFVASISHELRTPLAQMRLYLETLRLGRFTTSEQRTWSLDNVERETTRLSHLVERVLRFSRTGRPDDESRERIDAASEVRRIVEEFAPLASARGATLAVDTEVVPALLLRPGALRHIVLNLLDNAVKYGGANQTIRVSVRRDRSEVQLEVADEGPGIRSRDRDAVWRPYQRGGTAGHTAGSGLGLSIVRDVAVQHGGRAWLADAVEGEGARFVIALPIAPESDAERSAAVISAPTAVGAHEPSLG
ncbi:MAG: ATP-binding region ATPase domain protein [Gemmatimonadetes bacterium]|nr:ATP-binding region ATPase domain protein [Gemmatimonadota bacterium]